MFSLGAGSSSLKTILNVGRARTATVDLTKHIYCRLGTEHDMY